MKTDATRAVQCVAWWAVLVLAPLLSVPASEAAPLEGSVTVGWRWLTDSGSLSADAQQVRTGLRLRTQPTQRRQMLLRFDADDRRALITRHTEGPNGPLYTAFDDRLRLRRLSLGLNGGGGRLVVGRHRPDLHVLGTGHTDGVSWSRRSGSWHAGLAAGRRVAFWEPDVGPASGPAQWGGEVGWQPSAMATISTGLWHDEAVDGTSRLRAGVDGQLRPTPGVHLTAHAETEPGDSWLLWRLTAGWRAASGVWRVRGDLGEVRLPLFPVVDRIDSTFYGGRSRTVGLSVGRRWGRTFDINLRWRHRTGDSGLRSGSLQTRWTGPWRGAAVTFRLHDSRSAWRQLERVDLLLSSRIGRRLRVQAGGSATAFQWRTSRDPSWRARIRPQLELRLKPRRDWEATLRVEERIDEFTHLRTEMRAGLRYRL